MDSRCPNCGYKANSIPGPFAATPKPAPLPGAVGEAVRRCQERVDAPVLGRCAVGDVHTILSALSDLQAQLKACQEWFVESEAQAAEITRSQHAEIDYLQAKLAREQQNGNELLLRLTRAQGKINDAEAQLAAKDAEIVKLRKSVACTTCIFRPTADDPCPHYAECQYGDGTKDNCWESDTPLELLAREESDE